MAYMYAECINTAIKTYLANALKAEGPIRSPPRTPTAWT